METPNKLKELIKRRDEAQKAIHNYCKRSIWKCPNCNGGTQRQKISVIHEYTTERETGCPVGSYRTYWGKYSICCPKCDKVHRVDDLGYFSDSYKEVKNKERIK